MTGNSQTFHKFKLDAEQAVGTDADKVSIQYSGMDHPNHDIFFAAVKTTRMPMVVTDPNQPDNPIIFANPAFLRMTGFAAHELIGRNCRFLQGPATDKDTVATIRKAINDSKEIATEILNYRKDGSTFWNALFISPVYDQHGRLIYFFASQLDVSRRRDAEEALRQAQKMEALGQLTGGIAHDFNNLLQVMMGYIDAMDAGLDRDPPDALRLRRSVGAVRGAIERAATLTSQLLSFARKQRLQGRVLNPNRLLTNVHEMIARALGQGVQLQLDLADDLRNAHFDPTQGEVAILNVAINARDALEHAPHRVVTISTRNAAPDEPALAAHGHVAPGGYVAIAIADTGLGMPPEVVSHVLDPFFTTKDEGKGTGLGLSMVYGFVRQSGGALHIESEEGKGTVVTLYFPASLETSTHDVENPATLQRASDRRGNERILLVDDRRDLADVAQLLLEDQGYDVTALTSAEEAIALLCKDPSFDLLFTDLIMPGHVNGVMLAREARMIKPSIRVLLTTGFADSSLERTDAGGDEFDMIHKPYSRIDLTRKVRLILDGPTGIS